MGHTYGLPAIPNRGEPLRASQLRDIINAIRRYMPIAGAGIRVSYTTGGTIISARGGGGTAIVAGESLPDFPFKCEVHHRTEGSGSAATEVYEYGFYLPKDATARINGKQVNFEGGANNVYSHKNHIHSREGYGSETEWKVYDFGTEIGSWGTKIFCHITESGDDYVGVMKPESQIASDASGYYFPVCEIQEIVGSAVGSEPPPVTRYIDQFVFGEVVFDGDGGVGKKDKIVPFYATTKEGSDGSFQSQKYAFYLPDSYSLKYHGNFVPFIHFTEQFDSDSMIGSAWKCYDVSDGDVYCVIHTKDSGSDSSTTVQAGSELPDIWAELANSAGSGSDVVYSFPVCRVRKGGDCVCGKIQSTKIEQFAFGEVIIPEEGDPNDRGFYKIQEGIFTNCYYFSAGTLHSGPNGSVSSFAGQYCAILVLAGGGAQLHGYYSQSELNGAMSLNDRLVIPLYKFNDDGGVEIDMRYMPRADAWALGN